MILKCFVVFSVLICFLVCKRILLLFLHYFHQYYLYVRYVLLNISYLLTYLLITGVSYSFNGLSNVEHSKVTI